MAPFEKWDHIEDDDDDELEDSSWMNMKKDALLFAIDCSESMLELRDDGQGNEKSHLQVALEGCVDMQKRKAITGPTDSVGILIFNTAEKCDSNGQQSGEIKNHCHVYQPVGPINPPKIQELMELLDEANEHPNTLRHLFTPKSGEHVPMSDVFTSCNWMLRDGAPNTAMRRLFLITDQDDPHPNHSQLLKTAKNTLYDLRQLGVLVQAFFISTHEHPFKVAKFYSEVLAQGTDDATIVMDVVTSFDALIREMRFREAPKRALWSVPFQLGSEFVIGVKGYGLVLEQKRPQYVYRSNVGREQEEVRASTIYVDEELDTEVDPRTVVYGMSLGALAPVDDNEEGEPDGAAAGLVKVVKRGSKVFFTKEEVQEFRTMGLEPIIKLLGFKDLEELQPEDNATHSWFIYPDEMAYSGSTRTFTALLKTMVKKRKVALVLALMRRNSSPAFYYMVPQSGPEVQLGGRPEGFHLIRLPFADDLRRAPFEKACRAEDKTKDAAIAWIEKLKVKSGQYEVDSYTNPALALHYAQLEALAFNEEFDKDDVEDPTAPPTQIIRKRAGHLIKKWKEAINEDESSHMWFAQKGGSAPKPVAAVDDDEVRGLYEADNLKSLTVDKLKAFLKSKSLSVSGAKKAELLERVGDWLDSHPS